MCTSILVLQVLCVSDPALSSFPSSYVAIPAPVPPDLLTKKWHSECVVCHQSLQFITSKLPEHIQIGSFLPHIHLFDANSLLMSTRFLKWILSRKCLFLFYAWAAPALQPWSFILFIIIFIVHYLNYINNMRKRSYNTYYSFYYKYSQIHLQQIIS